MRSLLIPAVGLPSGEHISDARLFAVALVALAGCILWQGVVAWRHRRALHNIPVRIHVAGTRGKSTTTRLIAAALRAGGRRVVAKTTGSEPRLILPDGRDEIWLRRGPASIREQMRFVRRAVQLGADTIVVECMAIRPELVFASERHLIEATTTVITNTRADHLEDIGETAEASAQALAWSICTNGQLIVSAEAARPTLLARAKARGTTVTVVHTAGLDPIEADRALALAIATTHGVSIAIAKPAMDAAPPDPGSFHERALAIDGKSVRFANAFACNDVESLKLLWPTVATSERPVVLLNARRDRPLRTQRFLAFLAAQVPMPSLFVVGDPLAARIAYRAGCGPAAVRRLRARLPDSALRELAAAAPSGGVIWGLGNYQGFGARLTAELAGRDAAC
ncbi:MAG: poly-gamma-glutamate synthase PgsB [Microvirga sp.]